MTLAEASMAWQEALEAFRRDPSDEDLQDDLEKARVAVEVAWLEERMRVG